MATNPPTRADEDGIALPFVLPVTREEARLVVRAVDTGRGVRIHKTVSEQAHRIDQTLLRDAVSVTRVPVDKIVPLAEAPATRQDGDTWIVPILEEVLVVEKRLRIKEEVHITRTAYAEPYSDTVVLRTEHVSVERFDEGPAPEVQTANVRTKNVQTTNGGTHHATHTHRRL